MASQLGVVDRSFLLQEQLGEGGMGTVYKALQLVDGQTVALKLVPQRLMSSPEIAEGPGLEARLALAREFQTLASLHHPNVIRVLNYGFDEHSGPYFIMDLLDAASPLTEASAGQPLEVQVGLVAQLLRALVYIHQRGVIHRDIKPGSVLAVGLPIPNIPHTAVFRRTVAARLRLGLPRMGTGHSLFTARAPARDRPGGRRRATAA